jgi:HlyD family secretion protein
MKAVEVLKNEKIDELIPASPLPVATEAMEAHKKLEHSKTTQKWIIRIGAISAVLFVVLFFLWYSQRATRVVIVQARQAAITETITSSGRVGGMTETNVGSQTQGIVEKLYVDEGAAVVPGQQLALIKNDVAEAQISQAQATVNTAKSQLELASRGALASDIDAIKEQVRQADAQLEQQRAAIVQAQKNVLQTRSLLAQFEAERDLSKKNLDRSASLIEDGVIARSDYDQSLTTFRVADKKVAAQKQAIELAQSGVRSAQASVKSAQANVAVQQARLRTIQSGARPEDIAVAKRRISEADNALSVAREQAANAVVTAPFAGTVTKINTQTGQTVGALGVLTLVSAQLEIRLDVDENNLSSLKVGQAAVISSGAYSNSSFRGTVSELGAAVDQTRGTIQIKVIPKAAPVWLRPGQTVDVNIITAENVQRLLVPQTALVRSGDETVVFIIRDGKVAQQAVVTRPLTKEGVPVISGLNAEDFIISNASLTKVGAKVKAK